MRFYKAAANTGTHVGALWSADGTLLRQGDVHRRDRPRAGRRVTFAHPGARSPRARPTSPRYLAPNGHYSVTGAAFADRPRRQPAAARARPPARAPTASTPTARTLGLPDQQLQRHQLLGGRPVRPERHDARRAACLLALLAVAALLTACGGDGPAGRAGQPAERRSRPRPDSPRGTGRGRTRPARAGAAASPATRRCVERQSSQAAQPLHALQPRDARRRPARSSARRSQAPVEAPPGPDVHLPHRERRAASSRVAVQSVRLRAAQAAGCGAPRAGRRRRPRRLLRDATGSRCSYVPLSRRTRAQRRRALQRGAPVRARRPCDSSMGPPTRWWGVYQVSNPTALLRGHRRLLRGARTGTAVSRTVVLLGLDQPAHRHLVGDGRHRPAALPGLRRRVLAAGVRLIDGLYNGATAIVRLASGFVGDRWPAPQGGRRDRLRALRRLQARARRRRHRRLGDRRRSCCSTAIGKGIRTAPRDAMISLSTPSASARHRVRRAPGDGHDRARCSGPLLAFALLAVAPLAFDSLFLVELLHRASLGARRPRAVRAAARGRRPSAGSRRARRRCAARSRCCGMPRFRALLVAGGALSLATASDAFVFLALQDDGSTSAPRCSRSCSWAAPGMYMLLAVPDGPARRSVRPRPGPARRLRAAARASTSRCCSPLDRLAALVVALGLLGALLRGHRRRADGARQLASCPRSVRGSGLRCWDRHEPRPAGRLARLRRAVDAVGHRRRADRCFGVALAVAAPRGRVLVARADASGGPCVAGAAASSRSLLRRRAPASPAWRSSPAPRERRRGAAEPRRRAARARRRARRAAPRGRLPRSPRRARRRAGRGRARSAAPPAAGPRGRCAATASTSPPARASASPAAAASRRATGRRSSGPTCASAARSTSPACPAAPASRPTAATARSPCSSPGHSYADAGNFSTQTTLIDMRARPSASPTSRTSPSPAAAAR